MLAEAAEVDRMIVASVLIFMVDEMGPSDLESQFLIRNKGISKTY